MVSHDSENLTSCRFGQTSKHPGTGQFGLRAAGVDAVAHCRRAGRHPHRPYRLHQRQAVESRRQGDGLNRAGAGLQRFGRGDDADRHLGRHAGRKIAVAAGGRRAGRTSRFGRSGQTRRTATAQFGKPSRLRRTGKKRQTAPPCDSAGSRADFVCPATSGRSLECRHAIGRNQ